MPIDPDQPRNTSGSPNWLGATLDHALPRALGGSNDDFNLRLAHRWCNEHRGHLPIEELTDQQRTRWAGWVQRAWVRLPEPQRSRWLARLQEG